MTSNSQLIIVALDGSLLAEPAIPIALAIARHAGTLTRVEFVHVHEEGVLAANAPMTDSRWEDEGAKQMQAALQFRADRDARDSGVRVTPVMLRGPAADSLLQYATDRGADLIVMTTHGRSGFSRAWIGSVAEQVIHAAEKPVLVVRTVKHERPNVSEPLFHHVLIPIDRASSGSEALQRALALGTLGRTAYTLLTVVSPIPALPAPFSDPGVFIAQDDSARRTARAKELLDRLAEPGRSTGVAMDVRVVTDGRAASAILDAAARSGADLIVLSTHHRGPLSRVFLGSVAAKVLRGATVSLLLFPGSQQPGEAT